MDGQAQVMVDHDNNPMALSSTTATQPVVSQGEAWKQFPRTTAAQQTLAAMDCLKHAHTKQG